MTLETAAVLAGQITAILACVAAVLLAARKARRGYKHAAALFGRVATVIDLVEHELLPNSGGSMKDQMNRNDEQTAILFTLVDDLSEKFDTHLGLQAEAQKALWPAVEAIAKAHPPSPDTAA